MLALTRAARIHLGTAGTRVFFALAAGLGMLSCARESDSIRIERAVLTLPSGGAPAAVYFTVRNVGSTPVQLIGLEVDAAVETTMQSTTPHRLQAVGTDTGPTDAMSPVKSVTIGAGNEVRFAPGGYTGVIGGLRRALVRGDSVRLKLHVASRRTSAVSALVIAYVDLDSALGMPTSGAATVASVPSRDEGRDLYMSNGCATCHGLHGYGDGPVGRTLSPPPRDFRLAAAFRNGADAAAVAQTIATGLPNGGAMPRFAHLSNVERQSLALYILSIRTQPTQQDTTQ